MINIVSKRMPRACTKNAIWVVKFQIGLEFWRRGYIMFILTKFIQKGMLEQKSKSWKFDFQNRIGNLRT